MVRVSKWYPVKFVKGKPEGGTWIVWKDGEKWVLEWNEGEINEVVCPHCESGLYEEENFGLFSRCFCECGAQFYKTRSRKLVRTIEMDTQHPQEPPPYIDSHLSGEDWYCSECGSLKGKSILIRSQDNVLVCPICKRPALSLWRPEEGKGLPELPFRECG